LQVVVAVKDCSRCGSAALVRDVARVDDELGP
jgi:hypothetical protein